MSAKKKQGKKDEEDEPAGYNISIMTLDQLKQYARLLEGEIEDMRRHCNFYQKAEDELIGLLRIAEEDLKYEEDILLFKDVELEKLKLKFLQHLHEKRQLPKYMEHSSSEKKEKLSSGISTRLEEEQNRHISEIEKLKLVLQEKNRQLEALKVKIEMGRREATEKNAECLKDLNSKQKNALDAASIKYERVKKETEKEFKLAKEMMTFEVREGKIKCEQFLNEACISSKQNLHSYYKGITKQDLDTIKQLKNEIAKNEDNIKKSKALLEKAIEENNFWKHKANFQIKNPISKDIVAKFNASPLKMIKALNIHNKTEKLILENQILEKQVKNIMEQSSNLRRQFTLALGKVRESAEMKVTFLDQKLNFISNEALNKTIASSSVSNLTERSNSNRNMSGTEILHSDISYNS